MKAGTRFRCRCGYEAPEEARPGHVLVAVYHLHAGPAGWGSVAVRMEPVEEAVRVERGTRREMASVA